MHPFNGPRRINWKAVNTMQNQELDLNLVRKMNSTVSEKFGHPILSSICSGRGDEDFVLDVGRCGPLALLQDVPPEVFILAIEKEFKFSKGMAILAFADGGKNKVGHEVKYVKWYNIYGDDADKSKNKLNISEKTYTYGVARARDCWNEKVKEGYNRVK